MLECKHIKGLLGEDWAPYGNDEIFMGINTRENRWDQDATDDLNDHGKYGKVEEEMADIVVWLCD